MIVLAAILDGPITPLAEEAALRPLAESLARVLRDGESGASVRFEGIVRTLESGRELAALEYRTYEPMAERQFESLAACIARAHELTSITSLHSRGAVGVGQTSFVLSVSSRHRAASIAAVGDFIDQLKRDVPIWKRPVWRDES